VIEAKHDKSYSVPEALNELHEGRPNRDAGSGVFVLARSHARPGFPSFARYGQDVLVVWDHEDPSSDAYLQAALMVGVGLATRTKRTVDEGDLNALQTVEQRLVQELRRLDTIREAATKIRRQVETIEKEVSVGEKKLAKVIEDAKKTLVALNVELREEERDSPIVVETGGFADEQALGAAE